MGLLDLTREVVTEYKADVSEHVGALEELEGAEAELAEHELEQATAREEQAESFISSLAKVTIAVTALKEIGDVIWEGYNEGVKEAQLESTAAGVNIEALSEAAGGLKTNMELLEFAAKANSSAFHNTQDDMNTAEEAMRALEARGVPAQQAFDAVTGAMDNLKTKGLQSLGVYVDTTKEKFDENGQVLGTYNEKLEQHTKVMESLKAVALEVADGQDKVGDSMKRSQASLSDSWAELKTGLGQLVESMQPLLDALSTAVGLIAKIAKYAGNDGNSDEPGFFDKAIGIVTGTSGVMDAQAAAAAMNTAQNGTDSTLAAGGAFSNSIIAGAHKQRSIDAAQAAAIAPAGSGDVDMQSEEMNVSADVKAARKADAKTYIEALSKALLASAYTAAGEGANNDASHAQLFDKAGKPISTGNTLIGSSATTASVGDTNSLTSAAGQGLTEGNTQAMIDGIQKAADAAQKLQLKNDETLLSKTFGKTGDFDLYKKGFEALTSTVGTMYDALVSGSEPAMQAVKKVIGSSVEAVGKQMAVEALKEGAYALGDVALGNFTGAASHAAAAAEFAAGAVIAGVVARELGAGSSGNTPSSGSSGSSASSSSSSTTSSTATPATATPTQSVIVIGNSFANDSPRMQAIKASQLVALATGNTPAGTSS